MKTPVTGGAGRRSSAFVHKDLVPAPSGRLASASDFSTPKRSSDARIAPTEALHEGAACTNRRAPRRHRWGSCLLLLELHGAPKQQQVAESSIGDGRKPTQQAQQAPGTRIDGADEAIGASQPALCVGIDVQKPASGVFESQALSSASRRGGNRAVSATGGEHVASARARGSRPRESRSVMWTPRSLRAREARAFGSLATTPS